MPFIDPQNKMHHAHLDQPTHFVFARIATEGNFSTIHYEQITADSGSKLADIDQTLGLLANSASQPSTKIKKVVEVSKKHVTAVKAFTSLLRFQRGLGDKNEKLNVTIQPHDFIAVLPNIKCGKKNYMAFQHISFGCQKLHNGATFLSEQLLHLDYPEVLDQDHLSARSFDRVNIVTGVCLFGREIMNNLSDNPSHLLHDESRVSTLYQREFVRRGASAISDVVMSIIMNMRDSQHASFRKPGFLSVTIDIPSFEYLTKVADILDFRERLQWIECIAKHRKNVCSLFEKEINDQLGIRAIHGSARVRVSSKFDLTFQKLSQLYLGTELPCADSIKKCFDNVEHWNNFTSCQEASKQPRALKEFGHQKSIFELVQPTLDDTARGTKTLTIAVDDPWEQALHREANKILKGFGTSILSIYTCPRVAHLDNECRLFDLWYTDPGWHELTDDHGELHSIEEIVDGLHSPKPVFCTL